MNKKRMLFISTIIVFLIILIGNFFNNYNLLKQPPSEKWSKEVKIGSGLGKNTPLIIKEENRLLVAYEDTKKIKICETDLNGKEIKTTEYAVEEELLKNLIFTKTDNGYDLIYNSSKSSIDYLERLVLDEGLNLVKKETEEGITFTEQIDSENIVLAYKDKIKVVNTVSNENVEIPVENLRMITANKSKDGLLVCYLEGEQLFKAFTVKDGKASEPFLVKKIIKADKITYGAMSLSSDGENGYLLIEQYVRNEYSSTEVMQFPINGGEGQISTLVVDKSKYIVNTKGSYSENGAKFYATMGVAFGKKEFQKAIVSFEIKNGEVSNVEKLTRLRELCIHPYNDEDYIAFLSFEKEGLYDVNIASSNAEFKDANNGPRRDEMVRSLGFVVEGFMFSISYIIIIGFRWIVPALVLTGIVSFFDYKFDDKKKRYMYIILAAITVIMKTYTINKIFYMQYSHMLPTILAPTFVGILISFLIGLVAYVYGYFVYIDDLESIFLGKFSIFMLIDALLTLMVFVPLII
ncbi:hypothetical protein [uncultured Clostridium sp.]|uniref:hypothetical protein n=1 Tax=uncultured Clostridium sp. TaxID=59620 RepID=UPI003217A551